MALTLSQIGSEISTEKLVIRAVTDAPLGQVVSVIMEVFVNSNIIQHTLEHLPIFGTNNTFDFEINSIIKDYFASEFLPLSGTNQTAIENAIVSLRFYEVTTSVLPTNYPYDVLVKNITQDTFEIETFDLTDYDCGDAGSTLSKFLTSAPSPLPIGDLTSVHLSCLTTSYTGVTTPKQEWVVETFLNGVSVTTTTLDVDVPTRGIAGHVVGGKFDIATYRFDFDSSTGIDEVRFYIRDIATPFTKRSETRSYKLNAACERNITLSWLNEFGTQDTFTFLGNITRVGKYTDSTFKQVRPVAPVSTDVGDLVYKSDYNYQYDIFSDRMPEKDVQWLSKILINKRAAIQESPTFTENGTYFYNRYALNNGVDGDGRATGGIVNTSLAVWRVAQQADFATLSAFLGATAGGEMKQQGLTSWDSPNTGATNSSGFTALGQGMRFNGNFVATRNVWRCWTGDTTGTNGYVLDTGNATLSPITDVAITGYSVRLMRPAAGGEINGQVLLNAYTGNNGKSYSGVVIGTQVWINRDLEETVYNDGTGMVNTTNSTDWINLLTGSYCLLNNKAVIGVKGLNYYPIAITTEESTLADKFAPETLFRLKFRLANRRKGLK